MDANPWITALEMQFAALRQARRYEDQHHPSIRHCNHLLQAECCAFTRETAAAVALASRTVPMDTVIQHDLFKQASAWWWFDEPIKLPGLHDRIDACVAISWTVIGEEILLWAWAIHPDTVNRDPFPALHERVVKVGSTLTELAAACSSNPDEAATKTASLLMWKFIIAGNVWIHQRILASSSSHVERHRRKQLAREHAAPMPSDVKVIQLRRMETSPHKSSPTGEMVDWTCRWIVGGHWRNQIYKDERKLIYIMPFVKGPPDKPLRVPTHTVYQVSR